MGGLEDGAVDGVGRDDDVGPGLGPSGNVGSGKIGENVGIGKVNGLVGIGRIEADDMGAGVDGAVDELGRGVGATVGRGVGATVGCGVGFGVGVGEAAAIVRETVVVFDVVIPSDTRYVNVAVPENPPPGLYTSRPFDDRLIEPLMPPSSTTITVSVSPSASVSFISTPGAGTLSVVRAGPEYASDRATGAALLIVSVTVAWAPNRPARYLNESVPTYPAFGVYVKLPSDRSVSAPWAGEEASDELDPSRSRSLPRTPGRGTTSVASCFVA